MKRELTWSETANSSAPLRLSADGIQSILMAEDHLDWERDFPSQPVTTSMRRFPRKRKRIFHLSPGRLTVLVVLALSLLAASSLRAGSSRMESTVSTIYSKL